MNTKMVAADVFSRLNPDDWGREKALAEKMIEVRNGPLGGFTSQDARDFWDEYLRLLTEALDNPSLLW